MTTTTTIEVLMNDDAEAGMLGAVLQDCTVLDDLLERVDVDDFYRPEHRDILTAMQDARRASPSGRFEISGVRDSLLRAGKLASVGGVQYLVDLLEHAHIRGTMDYDCGEIVRCRELRQLAAMGQREITAGDDPDEIASNMRADLDAIACRQKRRTGAVDLADELPSAFEAMLEGRTGLLTGICDLDFTLNGLHAGELVIVGARPSMGKSAFALSIALNAIRRGTPVCLVSLEMSKAEILQRLICMFSGVSMQRASKGTKPGGLSQGELDALQTAGSQMLNEKWPLSIIETNGVTGDTLPGMVARERRRRNIGLVIVDYLQLLPPSRATASQNRTSQITDLSRTVKLIAMGEQIPVIALSQLNRAAEGREGHRPRMADLRESGSIEQDADCVVLLHRDDHYRKNEPGYRPDHMMHCLIAKHRNGPTGMVSLNFHEEYMLVTDAVRGLR